MHRRDEATRIVQRHEAGEEIIRRGGRRRGGGQLLDEGFLQCRLFLEGRGGRGRQQRAGTGQRHTGGQRGGGGHDGGEGKRQARNGRQQRQRGGAQRRGRTLTGSRCASNASNGAQAGCHSVSDGGQLAQRKTPPFMFFW